MQPRRSEYDVTNQVNTTDPQAVHQEVSRIYLRSVSGCAHGDARPRLRRLRSAVPGRLPRLPGLRHRLPQSSAHAGRDARHGAADGRLRALGRSAPSPSVRACSASASSPRCSTTSATCAIATTPATRTAPSTRCSHVSRGSRFVEHYMSRLGMSDLAPVAAQHHPLHRLRDAGGRHRGAQPRCSAGSATCSAPPTSSPRWPTAAIWRSAATGCFRSSSPAGSPPTAEPNAAGHGALFLGPGPAAQDARLLPDRRAPSRTSCSAAPTAMPRRTSAGRTCTSTR